MPARIAAELRTLIHTGTVPPGGRFQGERELAQEFSVSRATLRQALKVLQEEGYIEVRRGPYGGAFVTSLGAPLTAWKEQMASDFAPMDDLFDFRVGVEMAAARFAAERRTDEDIVRMRESTERLATAVGREQLRLHDARFHECVAEASGSSRLLNMVREVRGELFLPVDFLRDDDTQDHSDILGAIIDSNPDLASQRMMEHIEHTREQLRKLVRTA